jgi:hypothetical protein
MQQLHRVTLWRRARKARENGVYRRGRRPVGRYHSQRDVWLAGESATNLMFFCGTPAPVSLETVERSGTRPILFALAVWDLCGREDRTRKENRPFWDFAPGSKEFKNGVRAAAVKLADRYEKVTKEELESTIDAAARSKAEWLIATLGVDRQSAEGGRSAAAKCPAKFLETSRRMVSYWRKHPEYPAARDLVLGLISHHARQ